MKKVILFFTFNIILFNVYAVQNGSFCININENVNVDVGFFHFYNTKPDFIGSPNGLYWNLLIWAKNVQNVLSNKNESVVIFIDNIYNTISIKNNNGDDININLSNDYFLYDNYIDLTNNIITLLNTFYCIDVPYNNLNNIEIFIIKGRTHDRIYNYLYNYKGKVFSKYVFFSKVEAENIISNNNDNGYCSIKKVKITKKNIVNYIIL